LGVGQNQDLAAVERSDPMAGRIAAYPPPAAATQTNSHPTAPPNTAGRWTWPTAAAQPATAPRPGPLPTATLPGNWPPQAPPLVAPPFAGQAQPFGGPLAGLPGAPPIAATLPTFGAASTKASGEASNFFGETRFEQGKSVLAIVGVIAILLTLFRGSPKK
jgi:hypothetical protein